MKKIFKKLIIVLGSILGLLLIVVAILFLQGNCFTKGKLDNTSNKTWMSSIKDDAKLNDIVIPGSHDSGTKGITYMLETQNFTVKDQLSLGVRYFDIRVRKKEDDLYIYHSFANGDKFLPIIDDIVEFIVNNPSEVLLLDFQHFDKGAKADVYNIVKEKIVDKGLALTNSSNNDDLTYISGITLKDSRGKCIIFFGEGEDYANESYIFARNNDLSSNTKMSLNSTYISKYNKMNSKDYIKNGIPEYINQIKNKIDTEGNKGIFVLQGQLTDGKFIFGPYSKECSHNKNMNEYIESLRESDDLSLINVIMRDFLNEEKCNQIISLNKDKGLYK